MKIQIMGGKITENLGVWISASEGQKNVCPFSVHFQILHKNNISMFLAIFEYRVILNILYFLTLWNGDSNPRFSVIFPPTIWIFMEGEGDEIKSRQGS